MVEVVAVESLVRGAAARHPELQGQMNALGRSIFLSLCERAVQDPEPNASQRLDFGETPTISPAVLRTVFEIAVLARVALQIVKVSLADEPRLREQLKAECARRALKGVTSEHIAALAAAAVEPRGSERQIRPPGD